MSPTELEHDLLEKLNALSTTENRLLYDIDYDENLVIVTAKILLAHNPFSLLPRLSDHCLTVLAAFASAMADDEYAEMDSFYNRLLKEPLIFGFIQNQTSFVRNNPGAVQLNWLPKQRPNSQKYFSLSLGSLRSKPVKILQVADRIELMQAAFTSPKTGCLYRNRIFSATGLYFISKARATPSWDLSINLFFTFVQPAALAEALMEMPTHTITT